MGQAKSSHIKLQNGYIINWVALKVTYKFLFLDAKFLLRFLRSKKFSVTQAQLALERYLLLRQSYGVIFSNLDLRIPMMEDLTDRGYLFACPKRDSKGRRVVIARPG